MLIDWCSDDQECELVLEWAHWFAWFVWTLHSDPGTKNSLRTGSKHVFTSIFEFNLNIIERYEVFPSWMNSSLKAEYSYYLNCPIYQFIDFRFSFAVNESKITNLLSLHFTIKSNTHPNNPNKPAERTWPNVILYIQLDLNLLRNTIRLSWSQLNVCQCTACPAWLLEAPNNHTYYNYILCSICTTFAAIVHINQLVNAVVFSWIDAVLILDRLVQHVHIQFRCQGRC